MSTHNICFCGEIRKILCGYPLLSVAMETLKSSTGVQQTAYWYDILEQSCLDPLGEGGGPPLLWLVPPSYLGKTYSKQVKLAARGPG